MQFSKGADVNGTSYQGQIEIDLDSLIQIFGPPDSGPDDRWGDKVTCEWCLQWADGMVTTIYDYKTGRTPRGRYAWHVGGRDRRAAERIQDYLQINLDPLVRMVKDHESV